jgi:hypothetical protein
MCRLAPSLPHTGHDTQKITRRDNTTSPLSLSRRRAIDVPTPPPSDPPRRWVSSAGSPASSASPETMPTTPTPHPPTPPTPPNSRRTGWPRRRRHKEPGAGSASRCRSLSSGRGPRPCSCPALRGTAACR